MTDRGAPRKPTPIGIVVAGWLGQRGTASRGGHAGVTGPQSIPANGTLFVKVTTNAWMTELSLLEPELLRSLNSKPDRTPIRRIRWQLRRHRTAEAGWM